MNPTRNPAPYINIDQTGPFCHTKGVPIQPLPEAQPRAFEARIRIACARSLRFPLEVSSSACIARRLSRNEPGLLLSE
jgi:hypothetical protein